ncbi:putative serine/threonine-protein kinase YrzF [Siminovitchia terrae]|uniref:Protein kinase family protein n=1 Tax=Siminovitchia terrae TaxID=1914933 RepID=A0A429X184_SIMTE|nr:protein kinase family protein [Siminovitchia terrae]RST57177.1 protein kinase family protein [Siminovitchia terrae]GIN93943.1 putative serine/threonine-protein kinase YrzF [Siminovitchia terrae]GIN96259.1 putative serine/threonine-protein kinase YrzF [Siminovitchia terrae]
MNFYKKLAESVQIQYIDGKPVVVGQADSLKLIGVGRSAFVFMIKNTTKAMKVFFPGLHNIAMEEACVYQMIKHIDFFPNIYESGSNYIVIDYIEGHTLFECLTLGIPISEKDIKEIDFALYLARKKGLNPSDVHLRNIIITPKGSIKIIDVARFRQSKKCHQWEDIKSAFYHFYLKPHFPKRFPAILLNGIAYLYKKIYQKRLYVLNHPFI